MAFLKEHQLNIMLFMSGVCCILAVLTAVPKSLSSRRRSILAMMTSSAMLLLLFDRAAYLYRGEVSDLGSSMVRISNGLVYFFRFSSRILYHGISMTCCTMKASSGSSQSNCVSVKCFS